MGQKLLNLFFLAGIVVATPTFTRAEDPQKGVESDRDQVLNDLHHSNLMEIQMGKLAKKQGRSDAIKNFGDTLVMDHGNADKKVVEMAKSKNVKLMDSNMPMGDEENNAMNHLRSLHGSAFDLAFAQAMVEDHRQDIAKLQAAQTALSGTPTGELVTSLLPVIEKHEQIATDLVAKLNVSGNQKS